MSSRPAVLRWATRDDGALAPHETPMLTLDYANCLADRIGTSHGLDPALLDPSEIGRAHV